MRLGWRILSVQITTTAIIIIIVVLCWKLTPVGVEQVSTTGTPRLGCVLTNAIKGNWGQDRQWQKNKMTLCTFRLGHVWSTGTMDVCLTSVTASPKQSWEETSGFWWQLLFFLVQTFILCHYHCATVSFLPPFAYAIKGMGRTPISHTFLFILIV